MIQCKISLNWAGCACGQRQTDNFTTCQTSHISILLYAHYYCTGFHSWALKHVVYFQSVDANTKPSDPRGALCEDIPSSATAAADTEANCAQKLTSRTLSDGNHLLLHYKVSQTSQGKLHAHMEEFLYTNIRKHSGHGLMSVTIHNCRDQILNSKVIHS